MRGFSHRSFFVYGLVDPVSGFVRYVGKVNGYPNSRFRQHLWQAARPDQHNHRLNWLRALLAQDLEPKLVILQECLNANDLVSSERLWIALFRWFGLDLVNGTDGGEGMPNPSEATRIKLRARPQVGFPVNARERARESMNERWKDPAFQTLMKNTRQQRDPSKPHSRAHRGKRGPTDSPEYQEWKVQNAKEMGYGNRGKSKSEAHRQKLSASVKHYYKSKGGGA